MYLPNPLWLYNLFYFDLLMFCRLGDYVTMGGRAMVRDHVSIASKVIYCFFNCSWVNDMMYRLCGDEYENYRCVLLQIVVLLGI